MWYDVCVNVRLSQLISRKRDCSLLIGPNYFHPFNSICNVLNNDNDQIKPYADQEQSGCLIGRVVYRIFCDVKHGNLFHIKIYLCVQ